MAGQVQFKPSAPIAFESRSSHHNHHNHHEASSTRSQLNKKRYIQCCGCISALLLIIALVILVLNFTVFRLRDPLIRLNSLTIQSIEISTKGILNTDVNVTLLADVSIKNPNAGTFEFDNCTTMVYYGSQVVGESVHFGGEAKARRTIQRNVTVVIDPERIVDVPGFVRDITSSRGLNIRSYTIISGRIDIMSFVEKKVVVKFNCTVTFRLSASGGDFHGEECKPELGF